MTVSVQTPWWEEGCWGRGRQGCGAEVCPVAEEAEGAKSAPPPPVLSAHLFPCSPTHTPALFFPHPLMKSQDWVPMVCKPKGKRWPPSLSKLVAVLSL